MVKDSFDIESAFRPLNVLSKILGLAHFSGHGNTVRRKIKHEQNCESEFANVVWRIVVILTVIAGFVTRMITMPASSHFSIFDTVVFILLMPVGYLGAVVALIAGLTFNRNKFPEFVLKVSIIDKDLFGSKRVDVYKKQYKSCIKQLKALPLIFFPFYCYVTYVFSKDLNCMQGHLHLSNFIKEVVILQFINVVWMITERLKYLNKEVANSLEFRTEVRSNAPLFVSASCISNTESALHTSPLEFGNKNAAILLCDFPVFTRRRSSFSEVDRLIRVRKLYDMIYRVSKLVNGMYGIHIVLDLIYNFINVVVSVYGIIGATTGSIKINPKLPVFQYIVVYICWIVVCLAKVVAMSVSCHKASAQVEVCCQEVQKLLISDALRQDTRRQLKLLLQQVSNNRVVFTACEFFTINMSFLFTFVSSATTYIVVLVQVK
ncbi:hypothetical protein Cfor_10240 [Coptotermes formosanus]|uniref:Gustatory receptor n=1 Tax=Coptotermes formosanus TaxID=36987 RepID=A0A6L2PMV5_COPFO|nr:hypothetical protein Cfor_10237 [Coptotermes formosanus]GFG31888.1 hypothetical protein Cfor_10240 [Coptotermes formosanus]